MVVRFDVGFVGVTVTFTVTEASLVVQTQDSIRMSAADSIGIGTAICDSDGIDT